MRPPRFATWCSLACLILLPCVVRSADEPGRDSRPYRVAHEAPLHATESVVQETDDYGQLRVEFDGIQGDRVPAFLYVPRKASGRRPAVLLQYGSGGSKKTDYIVEIGKQFVTAGFVVLTIDSPGRGERKGQVKKSSLELIVSGEGRQIFLQYCGDYSRAVDYLMTRPEVDGKRVGYVGISWGAITGIPYVAHDERIRAVTSLVGGGGFLGQAGSPPPSKPAAAESATPAEPPVPVRPAVPPIDPVAHVARIAPRPLLLINVTKDQLVPRPFAEALHKAAGKNAKIVWLDSDHYFTGIDRAEVVRSVIRFMEEGMPAVQ
jgi:dienelactone hydrolase